MLILTRRIGETLVIRNDIEVTVLNIKGNQVQIGIKAPKDVVIVREELLGSGGRADERRHPADPVRAGTIADRRTGTPKESAHQIGTSIRGNAAQ